MAIQQWRLLLGGLRSLVIEQPLGTGGTVSARYCYSVFMRHRVVAAKCGLSKVPRSVLELGPGDSLGIGLMALLTGSELYIGIDAVRHASIETNLEIFDNLVKLLKGRTCIPNDNECAAIRPKLSNYEFPYELFSDKDLKASLESKRLERLKRILLTPREGKAIQYLAPRGELGTIRRNSIDWIFSQAVLEHVDNLRETYNQCFAALKADGFMTHQVDYKCHETANEWNGHWKYHKWLWTIMRGRRSWFINRLPYSVHVQLQKEASFELLSEIIEEQQSDIKRTQLAKEYRALTVKDMQTSGAMFVLRKK